MIILFEDERNAVTPRAVLQTLKRLEYPQKLSFIPCPFLGGGFHQQAVPLTATHRAQVQLVLNSLRALEQKFPAGSVLRASNAERLERDSLMILPLRVLGRANSGSAANALTAQRGEDPAELGQLEQMGAL